MTSIIGIRCGGFDQCSPTTRDLGDLRDRDARGVRGEDGARRRELLELREQLLLELEALGNRLGHELRSGQRSGQVALVADAAALDARRLEPVEHAVGELKAALCAFQRLGAHVVDGHVDAGPGEYCSHARSHRARADHGCSLHVCHVPS
jgi:hypothetical protein